MIFCTAATATILLGIIGFVLYRGLPALSLDLLTGETSYLSDTIGILPNILNTLYLIIVTMLLATPVGVGAAIYLNEYARQGSFTRGIRFALETLAGIPSIICGLVGMLVFIHLFGLSQGILAGGLTLVIMVLPTIVLNTLESLQSVPNRYREGALALGGGKFHMVATVVLPSAMHGIATGCVLAVGRIVGESAALLYTAGFGLVLNDFFTALETSSAPLTVALYVYASERGAIDVAFAIGAVLMTITLVLNFAAHTAAHLLRKG
ncbi:phosphate ABC transporter, permease protein PstA [Alloscardovia sp. HMSC034E08]|nr:phosphate ABC transporter, permease protein PstA [Alloscardovia sp. HMSC034E08]